MVDEVAGGLHGHPAVKIRPSFGQLVDVQQCLQWEDTFWTSWARSPGSCGGCSSLPSCWDTTANGGRRLYYEFCQQVVELNKSLMEKCYYEVYQQEVELNEAAWRVCYYKFYQQEVELKEATWTEVVLRVLPASGGA